MDVFGFIRLAGGLALFLYGMSMLGDALERASGGRLEQTLEKLTSNIIYAVGLGMLVTAAIQSSSATTVIVVGLVNAKVLKLRNAIGVIMGANIGTTVTAHILRLSEISGTNPILLLLKPTTLAPIAAVAGLLVYLIAKRDSKRCVGLILLGFAILFTGMFAMEEAVRPLRDDPLMAQLFTSFKNPIIGVLVGTFVTAAIQSSSASVGILQALSSTGFITYSMAFPIIMGQNIGTCITPILASIGASKNAKRSAAVHVSFNVIGTVIFLAVIYSIQSIRPFPFWNDAINKGGIANFHTVFNVTVTLVLIPFAGMLEKLACLVVKDTPDEGQSDGEDIALDSRLLVSPGLALTHSRKVVSAMAALAQKNLGYAWRLLEAFDGKLFERLLENENTIDKLQDRVENYLVKLAEQNLRDEESRGVSELLHVCGEFERIADHANGVAEKAKSVFENKAKLSKRAFEELRLLHEAVTQCLVKTVETFESRDVKASLIVEPFEQVIDEMQTTLKDRHIDRLRRGKCTVDAAFPYVEMLIDYERISDLCSNVALSVTNYGQQSLDKHSYAQGLRDNKNADFEAAYEICKAQYYLPLLKVKEKEEKSVKEKADKAAKEKTKDVKLMKKRKKEK